MGRAGMGPREMCCMSEPVPGEGPAYPPTFTSQHGVPPKLLPDTHKKGGCTLHPREGGAVWWGQHLSL